MKFYPTNGNKLWNSLPIKNIMLIGVKVNAAEAI